MKLVIVESPTKAKTIAKFLDKSFRVESSYGHIRDLPKSKLGIDLENDFEPQYVIPKTARKRVTELKKAAQKADSVVLATDADREGEAIAWHLSKALELEGRDNTERIVFHEITKGAIQEALDHPRKMDLHLVNAQQARRVLDRLVGYKLSPFLWKKVARGLSAGRVQSVALKLIVDREEEIKDFKADEYWTIIVNLGTPKGALQADLYKVGTETLQKLGIGNKADADKVVLDLEKATYRIVSIEKKETKKNPLPPFTTSTLQQAAAKRLGFSAQKTMYLAQGLYENGVITYMRTDSVNISSYALDAAAAWISGNLPAAYHLPGARAFKNKSRNAQEAHEAIRPTDPNRTPDDFDGDKAQKRLYDLIWRRFMASQLPEARFDATKVEIEAQTGETYGLRASGNIMKFDGFLKIWPMKFEEKELPPVGESDPVTLEKVLPEQHFTEPPPRYNEASLIKTLEKYGIGRPSTYAPIISVIKNRNYVEKQGGRFFPTEIGTLVNKVLAENFSAVVDIGFTAKMEEELDNVAEGKVEWRSVIGEFYGPFAKLLEAKYEEVSKKELVQETTDQVCEKCGKPMIIKMGRFGKFMACSGFPDCKTTRSLKDPPKPTGITCPKCLATDRKESPGELIEKKVNKWGRAKGKVFWGCNKYPECDFATWTDPTKEAPIYDPIKEAEDKAAREAKKASRYPKKSKEPAKPKPKARKKKAVAEEPAPDETVAPAAAAE
jgi:DNA topoisomerase I